MTITTIMEHEGIELRDLLKELGIEFGYLAKRMDTHRNTITNYFKYDRVPSEKLIEIGRHIRFDMRSRFPRLKKIEEANVLNYFNEDPVGLLDEVKEAKQIYLSKSQLAADQALELKLIKEQLDLMRSSIKDKEELITQLRERITQLDKSKKV
jgi:hypothetical protein